MDMLKNLLSEVDKIVIKDKTERQARRERGEDFNVFFTLGLYSEEVRLHSAFLAELLNANGSHGLKDLFLDAFLKEVIGEFKFNTQNSQTFVEMHIGKVTETTGGRIDIVIENEGKDKAIIIENKIYANDVKNQLLRYYNYAKKNYKNGHKLIYLTLHGNEASNLSTGEKAKFEYETISYGEDILRWLNRCVELSACQPLIRETIRQYISLIQDLTGKNMNKDNDENLVKVLIDEKNIEATFSIINHSEAIKRAIKVQFLEKLQEYAKNKGLTLKYDEAVINNEKESWMYFCNTEKWGSWAISIGRENDYRWYYGISSHTGETYKKELKPHPCFEDDAPNEYWPFGSQYMKDHWKYWNNPQTLQDMVNGKLYKYITEIVDKILNDGMMDDIS